MIRRLRLRWLRREVAYLEYQIAETHKTLAYLQELLTETRNDLQEAESKARVQRDNQGKA